MLYYITHAREIKREDGFFLNKIIKKDVMTPLHMCLASLMHGEAVLAEKTHFAA